MPRPLIIPARQIKPPRQWRKVVKLIISLPRCRTTLRAVRGTVCNLSREAIANHRAQFWQFAKHVGQFFRNLFTSRAGHAFPGVDDVVQSLSSTLAFGFHVASQEV